MKHLERAIKSALKHEYGTDIRYRLCAVLVKGGSILSIGFNDTSINSFVRHYATAPHTNLHAEVDAILQARRKSDLNGCKIYVARVRRDNSVALARPCNMCQNVLARYGIRTAIYTINENEHGVLKCHH